MAEKPYRIVMEAEPANLGGFALQEGYYGHVPLVGMNHYIYCRVRAKDKAWTYTADECVRQIEQIREKGYRCLQIRR